MHSIVVDDKVYVMGGKKLPSQIFNTMWMLDLSTLVWTMIWSPDQRQHLQTSQDTPSSASESSPFIPEPRYFHTASNYKNEALVIFGGLGPPEEESKGERCLDDLVIFDLATRTWRAPAPSSANAERPAARYAHVASINRDRLVAAGGELRYAGKKAYENLTDIHVFDLLSEKWVHKRSLGGAGDHIGYYRSVMVSTTFVPRTYPIDNLEEEERLLETADQLYTQIPVSKLSSSTSEPSSPTQSFRSRSGSIESPLERRPSRGNLNSIPETESSEAEPYIYIYSTRQRTMRELSRLLMKLHSPQSENFTIEDYSSSLPPRGSYIPLRFPSGDIVGDWLIYCGTVPNEKPTDATARQQPGGGASAAPPLKPASFHILSIHLPTKQSKVIDVGNIFLSGSWNRGIVSPKRNAVIVFGNSGLDMTTDYTMRRANFNHVVLVDTEVFGIYNVPKCQTATFARGLALRLLGRKEYSDMDIVTKEGYRLHVNSRILAHRWPMFTEVLNTCVYGVPHAGEQARRPSIASTIMPPNLHPTLPITERPRVLYLPLREEQAVAFLEYIYTDSLHPEVDVASACALLTLSKRYEPGLERLADLAADILHRRLNEGNAWQVIEAAAYAGRTGLQVQAMLIMRTAADLRIQAQRRRMELKGKEVEPNGTGMVGGASSSAASEGAGLESVGSNQSMESSQIIPQPLAVDGKAE